MMNKQERANHEKQIMILKNTMASLCYNYSELLQRKCSAATRITGWIKDLDEMISSLEHELKTGRKLKNQEISF